MNSLDGFDPADVIAGSFVIGLIVTSTVLMVRRRSYGRMGWRILAVAFLLPLLFKLLALLFHCESKVPALVLLGVAILLWLIGSARWYIRHKPSP